MGERLTKEREEEIRARLEIGRLPVLGTALDVVAELLAELDALRAAPPTTYLHADGTEEPIGELVARLTRERDGWRLRADDLTSQRDGQERDAIAARAEAGAERKARMALEARVRELLDAHAKLLDRLETAEARVRELEAEPLAEDLAETRAQLARLREAAEALCGELTTDRLPDGGTRWQEALALRAALSTPGPTLAEIERAAQVRALMDAEARWMADHAATPEAVAVAAWLRQRADDLEAGRG